MDFYRSLLSSDNSDCYFLSSKGLTKQNPLRVFDKTTLKDENIRFVYEKNGYEVDLILSKDRFFNMLREGEIYVGEYFCYCIEKALALLEKKERITETNTRDAIILTMQILGFDCFLNYFLQSN